MARIPPGLPYLAKVIPRLAKPFVVVYVALLLTRNFTDISIPGYIEIAAYAFAIPAVLLFRLLREDLAIWRGAARVGGVFPPIWRDDFTPGSIYTVLKMARKFRTNAPYPGDMLTEHIKTLGPCFSTRTLFTYRVFTIAPEHVKAILATQFDDFEKGKHLCSILYPLLGVGVFASDGDMWKFHRSMTRPFFTRDRIGDFDNFDRHASDAIAQLRTRLREGLPVDFQDLVGRFTMDSATEFLFGHDVRSLADELPRPADSFPTASSSASPESELNFVTAFNDAQTACAGRMRFAEHWPLFEMGRDRVEGPMRVVRAHIEPILAEALLRKGEREATGEKKAAPGEQTLLEHLVDYTEDIGVIRDEILNIMIAGRDTTAATLSIIVYMLAQEPRVLHRLRQEVLDQVGESRRPTLDDFKYMKYMRAVINETLRLYPIVPFNLKCATKDTTLPALEPGGKPFYIPKNTRVSWSVLLMHRRKDLWGPDAEEFDPDRFLDERLHKYLTPNPFIFLPFNGGPRICLGQQFAYNEISFFLVRLLQNFSGIRLALHAQPPQSLAPEEWLEGEGRKIKEKVRLQTHLTMSFVGGLWVRMTQAEQDEGSL
ncbi:cytochrome P450 [Schizophyllum commune H4-8]|uniref:Cytochrome P450 n=1 Tax=Schizophyllum commune (strain H4-8 / FGSC 9210) TaxID=578458 RepID=D8Q1Q2_SCHCM|nr:cytochrome P450 [Schizophyllum commune H4-8]KAI5895522.1 cytochrome P450 [Schizophyllum commune H4-8]